MSEHVFTTPTVDRSGRRSATCSCGVVVSGPAQADVDSAMVGHRVEHGVEPTCLGCHGELADWSTTRDYVPALSGYCGRCRLEGESPFDLGRRR